MELAAYIHDAWAYEQANPDNQGFLDSNWLADEQIDQQHQVKSEGIRAAAIKWQACIFSAISITTFNGLGLNQAIAASEWLEPSVNTAPWCKNLYLCNTSYILEVQTLLAQRGFAVGDIDGVYGRYTKQAVIDFQRTQTNLAVDGIPGQQTLALLRNSPQPFLQNGTNQTNPLSNSSDRLRQPVIVRPLSSQPTNIQAIQAVDIQRPLGEEVGNLQMLLKQRGFYQGEIDGQQGQATTDAVLKAQKAYGLPQDGFAGPLTIRALLAGGQNLAFSEPASNPTPTSQDVLETQLLLKKRGFYEGNLDGVYNLRTRASILKAQLAYGQQATGDLSANLLASLKAQDNAQSNVQNVQAQNVPTQNVPTSQDIRPTANNMQMNNQTNVQPSNSSQAPSSSQNSPSITVKSSNSS